MRRGSMCAVWAQNRQPRGESRTPTTTGTSLKLKHKGTWGLKFTLIFLCTKLCLSFPKTKSNKPVWPQPKNPPSNCMFYKKCPGHNAQNEINPVHLPSCAISRPKLLLSCYAPELFLKPKAINVFGERTNPQITQCALCRLDDAWLWNTGLHCVYNLGQG